MNIEASTQAQMPPFDTDPLLALLFEKAAPHLNAQELEWIGDNAADCVAFHGRNLARTMESIGCAVTSDEINSMADSASVSQLLFVLASQVQTLATLSEIGEHARERNERRAAARSEG